MSARSRAFPWPSRLFWWGMGCFMAGLACGIFGTTLLPACLGAMAVGAVEPWIAKWLRG